MATLKLRALDSGFLELYTLAWPPETAGLDDATISMAMVVLLRPGGLLLALPNGAIPPEDLAAAAVQEGDALLGPHHVFSVPGFRDDGPDQPEDDQEVEVLVVDVSTEILPAMARYSEVDGATLCFSDDPSLLPSPEPLLVMVRQWLLMQASTKAAFYSAEEEMVPETPAEAIEDDEDKEGAPEEPEKPVAARKSNPKPKRVTSASLAEQITAVTQMLPSIADRLDSLQREQQVMRSQISSQEFLVPPRPSQQPVSTSLANFAKMVGSPPRVKASAAAQPSTVQKVVPPLVPSMDGPLTLQEQAEEHPVPGGSTLAMAVLEQSKALTSLVSHLQSGGDPLLDAPASSSGFSLGSKGAAGRERLQTELSNRSGNFFLAVTQNAWRRLKPAARMPQDIESVASTDFSMVTYLEKFGGYAGSREMGLVQFCMAHIYDAALQGDLAGIREHLALTMTAVEQSAMDGGRWDLAYQLTLLEEPAATLWTYRQTSANPRVRAFSPLCPQRWATVALAYLKEVDYIQSRRADLTKPATNPSAAVAPSPSPKKKWKAKSKASPEAQAE